MAKKTTTKFKPYKPRNRLLIYAFAFLVGVCGVALLRGTLALPHTQVGTNFHCTWSNANMYANDAERINVLDKLKAGNLQWVRIDVGWRTLEQGGKGTAATKGKWYLDRTSYCVNEAKKRGLKVLLTLSWSPDWSHPGKSGGNHMPNNPADYGEFAGWIAGYYKGKVDAWEIWNEPNLDTFLATKSPADYTKLLKAAYPKMKAAAPNTPVLGGALSTNDVTFLNAMYDNGAKDYMDVVAVHPYPSAADLPPETPYTNFPASDYRLKFSYLKGVGEAMAKRGDGHKPIWITEVGWSSHNGTSPSWQRGVGSDGAKQADYAVRAIKYIEANLPQVKVFIWYNEKNRVDASNPQTANYGLLNADNTPKPVYFALQKYLSTAAPAPAPTPTPSPSPTPAPAPQPSGGTINASADNYTDRSNPSSNFGSSKELKATDYTYTANLRFATKGKLPAGTTLTSVKLKLYATGNALKTGGFDIRKVSDSWSESSTTFKTQPKVGDRYVVSSTPSAGQWVTTSLPLNAFNNSGNSSFAVRYNASYSQAKFASREDAAHAPQLIFTYNQGTKTASEEVAAVNTAEAATPTDTNPDAKAGATNQPDTHVDDGVAAPQATSPSFGSRVFRSVSSPVASVWNDTRELVALNLASANTKEGWWRIPLMVATIFIIVGSVAAFIIEFPRLVRNYKIKRFGKWS